MGYFEIPEPDYDRYSNRQLAAIPLVVLAISLAILAGWWVVFGVPVNAGIDFTGGSELTIETTDSADDVEAAFDEEPVSVQAVPGEDDRYIVQFTSTDLEALNDQANANLEPLPGADGVVVADMTTSAAFGSQQAQMALFGLVIAFIGMSALAFVLFRTFVPSIAIVVSAFSDMMIPLAFMNLTGLELSLGTVAALLMIIGYSVDSDILLNNHILRRGGASFYENTYRAMQTGVTMTVTSMVAMLVMATTAWFFGVDLLFAIGLILFVGLCADLMNTYMLNLSLLRWYKLERVGQQ